MKHNLNTLPNTTFLDLMGSGNGQVSCQSEVLFSRRRRYYQLLEVELKERKKDWILLFPPFSLPTKTAIWLSSPSLLFLFRIDHGTGEQRRRRPRLGTAVRPKGMVSEIFALDNSFFGSKYCSLTFVGLCYRPKDHLPSPFVMRNQTIKKSA